MNLLAMFMRRAKLRLCLATFAGVVSGLSTTALIVIVNQMIHRNGEHPPAVVAAFAALCIVRLLTGIASHALLVRLSQDAIRDLRLELCQQIAGAPLRQLEQLGATRLTATFTEYILAVGSAVVNLPYVFVNTIILAGCFAYLGWLSWQLLLGIGLCIAVGGFSYLIATTYANRSLRMARQEQERLFHHFRQLLAGIKELKLHAPRRSAFMAGTLADSADRVCKHNTAGITLYSAAANWGRLLFFVYVGLLLLWPWNHHGAAELAGCVIVILYMMAPLEAILNALPLLAQAEVALAKINALKEVLGCEQIASAAVKRLESAVPWRELSLSGIHYHYETANGSRRFGVGPINLALRPGEVTFLVGSNGSGKTTLGKLIAGLYPLDSGEVRLDGELLSGLGHAENRALFSAVFDDFCLFDPSLGIQEHQLKQANWYLRALQLDHKVLIAQGRFSTTELSLGQRKRLALLVALLENRPIYLFDEWAADQDPEFKKAFYERIVPDLSRRGKAVVVISHDDRFFHIADQLVRLNGGVATTWQPRRNEMSRSALLTAMKTRERLDTKLV